MGDCDLRFSPSYSADTGAFKLLELPPDLCALVESAIASESGSKANDTLLSIKGAPNEDAVLCTRDRTYALRAVVLSNSVLVVTGDEHDLEHERKDDAMALDGAGKDVAVIRDTLHEMVELVPAVPKVHQLRGLLRGMEFGEDDDGGLEYGEEEEEDEDEDVVDLGGKRKSKRRVTYADAREAIQASDAELDAALREQRVLTLDGALRPMNPAYLYTVLELLLTALAAASLDVQNAPVDELTDALGEHGVRPAVAGQVMRWFGVIQGEEARWTMDVEGVVREVGLGILSGHRHDPISEDDLLEKWQAAVGDGFAASVSLNLLSGNYLSTPSLTSAHLTYFPSASLPTDPGARFTALFTARPRWHAADLAPFLAGVAPDRKEAEKLLLKFARATTDKEEGVVYTARAKLN